MNNISHPTKCTVYAIAVFIVSVLLLSFMTQESYAAEEVASGTCGDNLTWELNSDGALTIAGNGEMEDYSETNFSPWSSYRSQITTIYINEGVLSIGDYAFYNLYKATDVSFSSTINGIGEYAFANCTKLESIELSASSVYLGQRTFEGCSNLKTAIIPNISNEQSKWSYYDTYLYPFNNCTSLTELTIGGTNIPDLFNESIGVIPLKTVILLDNVKNISYASFYGCQDLTTITFPEGLETIGQSAFSCTGLKNVSFPNSLTKIGPSAFSKCHDLKDVQFSSSIQTIEGRAFESTALQTVTIPDNVVDLGASVFCNCSELQSAFLGDGIKELKSDHIYNQGLYDYYGVFRGCTSLKTVDLGQVESIGMATFRDCKNLTEIHFPSSLRELAPGSVFYGESSGAFVGSGLEKVYIDDLDAWIENYKMPFMENGIDVYLGDTLVEEIAIPDSITAIDDEKFVGINSIKRIGIPDSVTKIGEVSGRSFQDCRSLEAITIPESVSNVGAYSFQGCSNLKTVVFEGDSAVIQQGAFLDCSSLTDITLPKVIQRGDFYGLVFQNCSSLDHIDLRETKQIELSDFAGCENLAEVYLPTTVTSISNEFHVNDSSYSPMLTFDGVFLVEEGSKAHSIVSENSYKYDLTTGHQVSDWQTTIEPKCIDTGLKTGECNTCGRTITETIPATGHSFSDEFTVDEEPTCMAEGSKSKHCIRCSEITDATPISALGHEWDPGKITTEPTCIDEGVKTFTCNRCKDTRTEAVEALGHDFATTFTVDADPTCTTEGSKSKHCSRCSEITDVTTIAALGHTFGNWEVVTPSTCEGAGSHKHSCEICGFTETEATDPTGHDVEENYTVDVPATCTTDGSQSKHCKNCEVTFDSQVIPATGHNYGEWKTTLEPTCTEKGSKEEVCSACDDKVTEDIPALGHAWNEEPTVDKAATCTAAGSQSVHCARCSETIDSGTIPALGHDWETTATIEKAATCTEDGKESTHCTRCDAVKEGSEKTIPATGHQFSAWTTTKEATEIGAGQQSHKCSVCGKTETKTIAQLAPTLPSVKITKPKAAKKSATIKWKKVSKANQKKIAKIQIQYSTDKTFKTGVKTVYAKKSAASKKISKLTSKKTYYVRIRAYKSSGGVVHVSKWSTVKSVKAK